MSCGALLAAIDLSDLIGIAVVIFIMAMSAIWQWLVRSVQSERRMAPKPDQPAPPPERPREKSVDEEIGEFLRRAAQRGGPQQPQPLRPPLPAAEQPVRAEVIREVAAAKPAPVGRKVPQHVEQYLDTAEFTRRGSQLGGEVAQADVQLGKHLSQVFDHQVSKLAGEAGEAAVPSAADNSQLTAADQLPDLSPPPSADLAALFGDIDSIRQAIVMSEILRRPEDRWA